MKYYEPLTYVVPAEDDGIFLRTVLRSRMGISRKLLSRLKLTEQGITVNGIRRYIDLKVKPGDVVEVRMEQEQSGDILPEPMDLDILFEDDHLLIVNKPAGIVVHPTHGHYVHTLANGVVHHWRERGETVRFRPVHRLDQETSGVLAIAKNPFVHQHISEQMQEGAVDKAYLALVYGDPARDEGTVDGPIDRDPEQPHLRIVTPNGYPAVTHYRVMRRFGRAALLGIRLETGRTHQIRVHMQSIGHALLGDKLYKPAEGTEPAADLSLDRHALHAHQLAFVHPGTGKRVLFTAPLPDDLEAAILVLRGHSQ